MELETQRLLKDLDATHATTESVKHALKIRKALAGGNFARFFKLYRDTKDSGKYLIEVFIDKQRTLCLQRLAFACQTSQLELVRLQELLAFDDEQSLITFLSSLGCVLSDTALDCR